MRKSSRRERGFTLLEVMIATSLVSLVFGSLVAVLGDYSVMFREAQEKNAIMTLRRRIIQNLNRRESWIITYQAPINTTFSCFLTNTLSDGACPAGPNHFTLYGGRSFPPSVNAIVFTRNAPPTYTAPGTNYGLTTMGSYCNTFDEAATTPSARRCPIRLDLTWVQLSFGIPSTVSSPKYYPTGYMPYGYFEGNGSGSYFAPGYYPGIGSGDYWWMGTLGGQVRVSGTFTVNVTLKDKINTKNYDFSIIKEVP